MTDLIARCAALGWTLRPDGDEWELLGNGAPAAFGSDASLSAWLERQERAKARARKATMKPYYSAHNITIYHGDCRALILPEKPALILADPPYGIDLKTDYAARQRGALARCNDFAPIAGDDEPFDPSHILKLNAPTILWGANYYADKLPHSPSWLVWDKLDGLTSKREIGFNDQADLEMAWSNLGGPARIYKHRWMGAMKASERLDRRKHGTQKPVALMRWCLLRAKLAPGALVYDPYMGSGPIAQACKELGYRYIGCDLVESYCETAANRLQQEVMQFESEAA